MIANNLIQIGESETEFLTRALAEALEEEQKAKLKREKTSDVPAAPAPPTVSERKSPVAGDYPIV